jgi:hypothetical protein
MSCENTVTIRLDEFKALEAKAAAVDGLENNPDFYVILTSYSTHSNYSLWMNKRYAGHGTNINEVLISTNKTLQDQVFDLQNQQKHWYEQYKNLEEKVNSRRWFEFWK